KCPVQRRSDPPARRPHTSHRSASEQRHEEALWFDELVFHGNSAPAHRQQDSRRGSGRGTHCADPPPELMTMGATPCSTEGRRGLRGPQPSAPKNASSSGGVPIVPPSSIQKSSSGPGSGVGATSTVGCAARSSA